jgi:hypothetical protein
MVVIIPTQHFLPAEIGVITIPIPKKTLLSQTNLLFDTASVQQYWNSLENILNNATNAVAPLVVKQSPSCAFSRTPSTIQPKIKKRNRILKKNKTSTCPLRTVTIKGLNKEIKSHFSNNKKSLITSKITGQQGNIYGG